MDPIAFTLFGIDVHWYGIIIALGIVAAIALACWNAPKRGFTRDDPFELILWLFPPAVICARLYFLIFNGGPWGWESFAIWNGGIAIYGAVIGGALGAILYCVVRKKNFIKLADLVMPSLILGQAIGRWGNFANQEAYGNLVTDPGLQFFPYAVYIENLGEWHQATFFYESICDLIICVILVILLRRVNWNGIVLAGYLILYGIVRFFIEGLRMDSLMWGSIRVSQLLSLLLVLAGIAFAIYTVVKNTKKPRYIALSSSGDPPNERVGDVVEQSVSPPEALITEAKTVVEGSVTAGASDVPSKKNKTKKSKLDTSTNDVMAQDADKSNQDKVTKDSAGEGKEKETDIQETDEKIEQNDAEKPDKN